MSAVSYQNIYHYMIHFNRIFYLFFNFIFIVVYFMAELCIGGVICVIFIYGYCVDKGFINNIFMCNDKNICNNNQGENHQNKT